ncbi:MAG: AmmeMemoRadiSam system protein B [Pseudomonadota bacterium]
MRANRRTSGSAYPSLRDASAAGLYYPAGAQALRRAVDDCLCTVRGPTPRAASAVIVPHAGYRYSGPVAAHGFVALGPDHRRIRRVVAISSTHRDHLPGIAVPSSDALLTPLGAVRIDNLWKANTIGNYSGVRLLEEPHRAEHAIEVQLPFLQRLIGEFSVRPLLIGDADDVLCEQVIDAAWDDDSATVVVVSSDLSRYNEYDTARRLDREMRLAVEGNMPEAIQHRHAGAHRAIRALLRLASRRQLRPATLAMRNSADCIGGDPNRAIGFGAFAFH